MIQYVGKCLVVKDLGKKSLVVGDLHLGFEEALNRTGVFVSRRMFNEMIEYFDRIFKNVGCVDEIVLLGDVKHVFGTTLGQEWKDISNLFNYFEKKCKRIIVIKGNHDKLIGPIAKKIGFEARDFYVLGSSCFLHGDREFIEVYGKKIKRWVIGHGHPAVKLSDGVKVEKYKCFLVGKFKSKEVIILPSFFDYSTGSDPRENDLGLAWKFKLGEFNVKIVSEENLEVLDFGKLRNLN